MKQKTAAREILQMISARLRTPKINMALGYIYRDLGMERSAITCFKEVLRECPLALEAVENLLKLGVKVSICLKGFTLKYNCYLISEIKPFLTLFYSISISLSMLAQ